MKVNPMRAITLFAILVALGCGDDAAPVDAADASSAPDTGRADGAPPDAGMARADVGIDSGPPLDYLPAFPGADGYGTETPGGRGGRVLVVDTLDWSGPGSFSEALYTPEPRIIVFAVSGVIDVPGDSGNLREEHSYLTIAGETSPGGITFRGGGAALHSYRGGLHDVVVRHLRFRGRDSYDNLALHTAHHIVIDHCDFSGGTDEAFDITFSHDYTIQWSTITNSGPTGQRYGALLAYAPTANISFHHNYSAHHAGRCAPHMHWASSGPTEGTRVDVVRNVFYNCGHGRVLHFSNSEGVGSVLVNVVGNTAKAGPTTPVEDTTFFTNFGSFIHLYAEDNVYEPDLPFFARAYHSPTIVDAPHEGSSLGHQDRIAARDDVLARAGAWPRDPMGERTVQQFFDGTGELGRVSDPLITDGPTAPADADRDGMPDAWETTQGLDPADPSDAVELHASGYAWVEVYLHERAAEILP